MHSLSVYYLPGRSESVIYYTETISNTAFTSLIWYYSSSPCSLDFRVEYGFRHCPLFSGGWNTLLGSKHRRLPFIQISPSLHSFIQVYYTRVKLVIQYDGDQLCCRHKRTQSSITRPLSVNGQHPSFVLWQYGFKSYRRHVVQLAFLAHQVEHRLCNADVIGSSPVKGPMQQKVCYTQNGGERISFRGVWWMELWWLQYPTRLPIDLSANGLSSQSYTLVIRVRFPIGLLHNYTEKNILASVMARASTSYVHNGMKM